MLPPPANTPLVPLPPEALLFVEFVKSPKSVALPAVSIVTKFMTLLFPSARLAKIPLVGEAQPDVPAPAWVVSPKSVALPAEAMVTKSMMFWTALVFPAARRPLTALEQVPD